MSRAIRKILFGDDNIREYATVTIKDEIRESVYIVIDGTILNISQNHWLLCLDPIVLGVWLEKSDSLTSWKGEYKMYFTDSAGPDNKPTKSNTIADLTLTLFDCIDEKTGTLLLLKLTKREIHHIDPVRSRLLFHKYYKKPKLSFSQLKAFASAYSYPRKVRVISFKQDDYYNIFPMDLLGDVWQDNKFVFGLRHTNTALSKIIETKKLVVSEVSHEYKEVIYQLGSHHSLGPPSIEKLPFKVINSQNFGFYIPEWVDSYKEIKIVKTINLGSHMLLWGEVLNECVLKQSTENLFHIHYLLYLYQKRKGTSYPVV